VADQHTRNKILSARIPDQWRIRSNFVVTSAQRSSNAVATATSCTESCLNADRRRVDAVGLLSIGKQSRVAIPHLNSAISSGVTLELCWTVCPAQNPLLF